MTEALRAPRLDDPRWVRLREIIAARSLKRGHFRLASGRESDVLFDLKLTLLDPEGANLTAELMLDRLEQWPARCIGGPEMGGVLIVQALCVRSQGRNRLRFFFVRKRAKDHGTGNRIDGHLEAGAEAVLVEDVTTTGGSVMEAVEAVRALGCPVRRVLAILDRNEGGRERLAGEGLVLDYIFEKADFAPT
ncbi:MAG: orotate phosphoribosyltransferase [Rhodospirillaceae bacterium]|nr:orotate phosphoribosyltransferase [Rhodospirillaceae bacterium]